MYYFFYPLRYLWLRNENESTIIWSDIAWVLFLSFCISAPFIIIPEANYFGVDGFLDRFGAFSSVLTGFYVAALVAVATFSMHGDLDQPIKIGKVYRKSENSVLIPLTRREYVCYIFGYLAFISLALSIFSIIMVVVAQPSAIILKSILSDRVADSVAKIWVPGVALSMINIVIAHMIVTTCRGLIYLIDRLYIRTPKIISQKPRRTLRSPDRNDPTVDGDPS